MDKKHERLMFKYGLLGKLIDYSFSRTYFTNKFKNENLNCEYVNFDIASIEDFPKILENNPNVKGINVTIPYKEAIIPYLDKINKKAKKIGAVNTIKISTKGKLIGHNTDYYGFSESIKPHLKKHHKKALILGTGGASKAIIYALNKLNIPTASVSRNTGLYVDYTYDSLSNDEMDEYQIIVNCTPLGTYPKIKECPDIPYSALTKKHLLFDLVYNPPLSTFLVNGKLKGATICNGEEMLIHQAEKSWAIWNSP